MKAWKINADGTADVYSGHTIPGPTPMEGWVLIEIKAFGLNLSELYTR